MKQPVGVFYGGLMENTETFDSPSINFTTECANRLSELVGLLGQAEAETPGHVCAMTFTVDSNGLEKAEFRFTPRPTPVATAPPVVLPVKPFVGPGAAKTFTKPCTPFS